MFEGLVIVDEDGKMEKETLCVSRATGNRGIIYFYYKVEKNRCDVCHFCDSNSNL